MSDNPQYGRDGFFVLPEIRVVALAGRDALAFAQAQFMNDVSALEDGTWQWSGWLDPKGRVQALFALLRVDGETAWLVTSGDASGLAAGLARYVFRSKVKVAVSGHIALGRLERPTTAAGPHAALRDDRIEMDLSGEAGSRTLLLVPAAAAPAPVTREDVERARWWQLDVAHGWPALPGVALDHWTPQQLSLQRLHAFSVKKGCYPGQEIVARTHFLGRAKRGLARLDVEGLDAHPGDPLSGADDREVGQLVAVHSGEALAVVPLDASDAPLRLGGAAIKRLPLIQGLQR